MIIFVNNKPTEIADETTLEQLMQQLITEGVAKPVGTAATVNDTFVIRPNWQNTRLVAGDKIVLITAAFGG